jgi:AcrR family transcriptional regulator
MPARAVSYPVLNEVQTTDSGRGAKAAHGEGRRAALLDAGRRLFAVRPYDELPVEDIAAEAGVAKGLLYHYFGSKRGLYVAVVEAAAAELRAAAAVHAGLEPRERLDRTIEAYVGFAAEYPEAFRTLTAGGVGADAQVRAIHDRERAALRALLVEGLTGATEPRPALRGALEGWLSFVEGATLDWQAHRDLTRAQLRDLLVGALAGAVGAASGVDSGVTLRADIG